MMTSNDNSATTFSTTSNLPSIDAGVHLSNQPSTVNALGQPDQASSISPNPTANKTETGDEIFDPSMTAQSNPQSPSPTAWETTKEIVEEAVDMVKESLIATTNYIAGATEAILGKEGDEYRKKAHNHVDEASTRMTHVKDDTVDAVNETVRDAQAGLIQAKDETLTTLSQASEEASRRLTNVKIDTSQALSDTKAVVEERMTNVKNDTVDGFDYLTQKTGEKVLDAMSTMEKAKDEVTERAVHVKDTTVEALTAAKEKTVESLTQAKDKTIEVLSNTKDATVETMSQISAATPAKLAEVRDATVATACQVRDMAAEKLTQTKEALMPSSDQNATTGQVDNSSIRVDSAKKQLEPKIAELASAGPRVDESPINTSEVKEVMEGKIQNIQNQHKTESQISHVANDRSGR